MGRLPALLAIITMTGACASQPKPVELTKIADNSRVLLVVQEADSRVPDASSDAGTYAKNIGAGALAGAGMGAAAGFMMGFSCGPAVIICGPIGALGGAMGGTVFGIGMGTFSAASLQLPQEKAELLDTIIAETLQELDANELLSGSFQSAAASRWIFVDDDEEAGIRIVLEGIGLQKQKKDRLTVSMATTLFVQIGRGVDAKIEKRRFQTSSRSHHIDFWIENDGANFVEELQFQLSRQVRDMVDAVSPHPWDSPEF